jgi:aspartate carbamoyltransferase catalytic subunit
MTQATTARFNLLGLDGVPAGELAALLDEADGFVAAAASRETSDLLAGRIIANLFFEDSTRTRCSFTVAAHRLGATTVDLTGSGSSLSKGETLLDTALNLEAMGVDAMVVRSARSGTPHLVADAVACPVINAGDGRHEHPTQGLLDILTLRRRWGDIAGRTVVIVGDIANSRVARSNLHGLTTLGADVVLVGPPALVPVSFMKITTGPGRVSIEHDLDKTLSHADAVMMLRIQLERHDADGGGSVPPDYRRRYGLTVDRAASLAPEVLVMHPGPMNRGIEIDSEVADDPNRSVILEQVANGVAVRMAVLRRAVSCQQGKPVVSDQFD